MKEEIRTWAEKWVPRFNKLSKTYNVPYYTQSPLCKVANEVDIMFVGINPKGCNVDSSNYTIDNFLAGNECWEERFAANKNVWKFTNGARLFMGYNAFRQTDTIDNDARVIWTNLSPFQSNKGFDDLKKELREEGIRSTIELISILKPQKIVFLGGDAFKMLDKYADESVKQNFEHMRVLDKWALEIGRLFDMPAYYLNHPSGQWAVGHYFISVFVFLRNLVDIYENGKPKLPLIEVKKKMRDEFKLWQDRIKLE